MTWWVPIPDALNRDPRARVVSRSARGVLAQLLVEARGSDAVPYVNHHDGRGTVAVIAWCEGDGPDACVAEVRELVEAGLLVLDDVERSLRLGLTAQAPPRPTLATTTTPPPSARRVKPSDTPDRVRARKARHALKVEFEARTGACASVATSTTWEAWLNTEAGAAAYLVRVGTPWNAPQERPENAPQERPEYAPGTPPSPRSPLPREETEKQAVSNHFGARENAPGTPPGTPLGTPSRNAPEGGVPERPSEVVFGGGVRCGTVEHLGLDAEQALSVVRDRSRRAKLNLAYDARSLASWSAVVRDLAVGSLAPFEVLGDWIGAGGLGWWTQGRPSLAYLLRPGQLATHLEDAAQWNAAGRPPITHAPRQQPLRAVGPPRRGPAPVSDEFAPVGNPELLAIHEMEQRRFAR